MGVWALGPRADALLACCPTSMGAQRVTVAGSEVQRSHPYLVSLQASVAGGPAGCSPCCPFCPQLPDNFLSRALKEFKLPFISNFAVKRL